MSLFNECFPKIRIKNGYKNRKPWLTEDLKLSIKKKNKLFKVSEKIPTLSRINEYKTYKMNLNKKLKQAEKNNFQELFEKHKNNLPKSWQIIKQLINGNSKRLPQSVFKHNVP